MNNPDIDVIMGGGQANFLPNNVPLPADPSKMGSRADNKNLIDEWKAKQVELRRKFKFIGHPRDMLDLNTAETESVLGKHHLCGFYPVSIKIIIVYLAFSSALC